MKWNFWPLAEHLRNLAKDILLLISTFTTVFPFHFSQNSYHFFPNRQNQKWQFLGYFKNSNLKLHTWKFWSRIINVVYFLNQHVKIYIPEFFGNCWATFLKFNFPLWKFRLFSTINLFRQYSHYLEILEKVFRLYFLRLLPRFFRNIKNEQYKIFLEHLKKSVWNYTWNSWKILVLGFLKIRLQPFNYRINFKFPTFQSAKAHLKKVTTLTSFSKV